MQTNELWDAISTTSYARVALFCVTSTCIIIFSIIKRHQLRHLFLSAFDTKVKKSLFYGTIIISLVFGITAAINEVLDKPLQLSVLVSSISLMASFVSIFTYILSTQIEATSKTTLSKLLDTVLLNSTTCTNLKDPYMHFLCKEVADEQLGDLFLLANYPAYGLTVFPREYLENFRNQFWGALSKCNAELIFSSPDKFQVMWMNLCLKSILSPNTASVTLKDLRENLTGFADHTRPKLGKSVKVWVSNEATTKIFGFRSKHQLEQRRRAYYISTGETSIYNNQFKKNRPELTRFFAFSIPESILDLFIWPSYAIADNPSANATFFNHFKECAYNPNDKEFANNGVVTSDILDGYLNDLCLGRTHDTRVSWPMFYADVKAASYESFCHKGYSQNEKLPEEEFVPAASNVVRQFLDFICDTLESHPRQDILTYGHVTSILFTLLKTSFIADSAEKSKYKIFMKFTDLITLRIYIDRITKVLSLKGPGTQNYIFKPEDLAKPKWEQLLNTQIKPLISEQLTQFRALKKHLSSALEQEVVGQLERLKGKTNFTSAKLQHFFSQYDDKNLEYFKPILFVVYSLLNSGHSEALYPQFRLAGAS